MFNTLADFCDSSLLKFSLCQAANSAHDGASLSPEKKMSYSNFFKIILIFYFLWHEVLFLFSTSFRIACGLFQPHGVLHDFSLYRRFVNIRCSMTRVSANNEILLFTLTGSNALTALNPKDLAHTIGANSVPNRRCILSQALSIATLRAYLLEA